MSKVSKLVIKACSDNKFSSFTGEFITSINPENLAIKSAVAYRSPNGIATFSPLKYVGSPPKLLSFSLLFDGTGIMPGSNTIPVIEQVKQLQDVAYNVHKKNNAPNYIRVIWGQIDFKGRLVDLDIVYAMFQVDGTLLRAEAHIAVWEEIPLVGKGKSDAGVDTEYTKPSGASATSKGSLNRGDDAPPSYSEAVGTAPAYDENFKPTPNGVNGAYSGAPPGAYDGGPNDVCLGAKDDRAIHGSPDGSLKRSPRSVPSGGSTGSSGYGSGYDSDSTTGGALSKGKGGVAGNGPGGSGGGVGGGGHGPANTAKPGAAAGRPGSSSHGAGNSPPVAAKKGGAVAKGKSSDSKMSKMVAASSGVAGGAVMAATVAGADSLRKGLDLKGKFEGFTKKTGLLRFLEKCRKTVKKHAPGVYNAGKELGKKI